MLLPFFLRNSSLQFLFCFSRFVFRVGMKFFQDGIAEGIRGVLEWVDKNDGRQAGSKAKGRNATASTFSSTLALDYTRISILQLVNGVCGKPLHVMDNNSPTSTDEIHK